MSIAKFCFDVFTNTLTISKAFEKNASVLGSAEQRMMSEYLKAYGDTLVINRYKPHNSTKGLTFAKMKNYINLTRDANAMLKRFESVKVLSKSQHNPYKYVLKWFHDNYPNYSEQPEFDKDGFVIVKAAAPTDESHAEKDSSTAENAMEKLAEEPIENTGISRLPEGEDAPDQTEEAA